jgi:hypothetical protein
VGCLEKFIDKHNAKIIKPLNTFENTQNKITDAGIFCGILKAEKKWR